MYTNKYDFIFKKYATKYKLNPLLLKAIAIRESDLIPYAAGDKKNGEFLARGLMQIYKPTYNHLKSTNAIPYTWAEMWKPENNIHTGALLLRGFINHHGDLYRGIIQYNGHKGQYTPAGKKYLQSVIAIYNKLQKHSPKITRAGLPAGKVSRPADMIALVFLIYSIIKYIKK